MIERLKEVYKAKLAAEIAERKADISEHLLVIFGLELALSMFETACCEVAVEESESNKSHGFTVTFVPKDAGLKN